MWATIAGIVIILAQAAQPLGPGSKGQEWCFDRGQGAQLCEATEAECNRLRGSIPRSRKARADMSSRRRSSNRRPNRLRPLTRRGRRPPNDRRAR
jgi:hypothetical protein